MDETRGFSVLVGETVVSIDTSCINAAILTLASGKTIYIDGDDLHYGIPVISARSELT